MLHFELLEKLSMIWLLQKTEGQPKDVSDSTEEEISLLSGQMNTGAVSQNLSELNLSLLKVEHNIQDRAIDCRKRREQLPACLLRGAPLYSVQIEGSQIVLKPNLPDCQ